MISWWVGTGRWKEQKVDQIASTASYASKVRNSILFQILTPDSSKNGKINHFELTKLRLRSHNTTYVPHKTPPITIQSTQISNYFNTRQIMLKPVNVTQI